MILPSVIEDGAVSLPRSVALGHFREPVYSIFGFLFSIITWRFTCFP